MLTVNILIVISLLYVAFLFAIAFFADRGAAKGRVAWVRSPLIYTLSLSVYCTAWTFYGAVGNAARSGLEYLTIYLGPTLVLLSWWWLLRKLVRIGKAERITSIADLISSRYGKSSGLAVIVTLLAVTGTTPYIALQLQSVTLSFAVFAEAGGGITWQADQLNGTALWVAAGLAIFTILFGTRNIDTSERHHGVVMAIAVEAVVKLVALVAVGLFVVWGVSGGPSDTLQMIDASAVSQWNPDKGRWAAMTFVAAAAIICLPRMFQVMVVENDDETHLHVASWAFPLYLMAMSLFVLPIAVVGLELLPAGSNPDLFVLTIPLYMDQEWLAILAFLGGFSSATSMVIVAAIALSTMMSNHIVIPLWMIMRQQGATVSGDVRQAVILSRRFSIIAVLALGYLYFRITGGSAALSAIGLVSFAGVAQVVPALIGVLFWRGGTRRGAIAGLSTGFAVWGFTSFLPAIGLIPMSLLEDGLFGMGVLRPQALMGVSGLDPLAHSVMWSLGLNLLAFITVSLLTFPSPIERLQGASFINIFERSHASQGAKAGTAEAEDLLVMAQRLLGATEAQAVFSEGARQQGKMGALPDPTPEFVNQLERELASTVGAATANAMIGQINGQAAISVQDLLAVADESAQILEYSNQLEAKSDELEKTARKLRDANGALQALSVQKDAFLSQVSHELRTPMTSIRSFSEFLMEDSLKPVDHTRYAGIIHNESIRLTRLLDDLLDLTVLENGQVELNTGPANLVNLLDQAEASSGQSAGNLVVTRTHALEDITITTDRDRLVQVFINLISNAQKYCQADIPSLNISTVRSGGFLDIIFEDNGLGIPPESQSIIFEKFARLSDQAAAGSAGLGLAISREIMGRLGGTLDYVPGKSGAVFRVRMPHNEIQKAAE
ncbi:MAG: ATP-binding protein [Litoreibacter sp.]